MSAIVSGNAAISLVKTSVCLLLPILVSCENKSERDHGEVSVTRQNSFKEKALLSWETSLQNDSLPSVKNLHKSGADLPVSPDTTQTTALDSIWLPYLKSYTDTFKVNVIGIFGQVEGDGEHSYGSIIELWKIGDEVIGFFNYYDGNVEADVGLITSGKISGDSIIIRGVLPEESDKEIFSVEGILQKNKITASLSLRQQKEEVQLHKNQDWNIKDYKYFREWKEDKKYVLRKFSLKRSK